MPAPFSIRILTGAGALHALEDESFQRAWTRLFDSCPWSTGCQSFHFARAWYFSYREVYEPAIVSALGENSRLVGVLPLAVSADGQLLPCGGRQAEYPGWLAEPELCARIMAESFRALWRRFPSRSVTFRYVPPGAPLDWTGELFCVKSVHQRPLMALDLEAIRQDIRKKSKKNRWNHLDRLGQVSFLQVAGRADLESWIDRIAECYDFRRGAADGILPFREDPHKREFCLSLLDAPDPAHAVILKAGNDLLAAHLGIASPSSPASVSLGLITHSPAAAMYSPGKLLILYLAGLLAEQNYELLDLTAGGGSYKDHFATSSDSVWTLTVFGSRLDYLRHRSVRALRTLAKRSLSSPRVLGAVSRALADARSPSLGRRLQALRPGATRRLELRVFQIDAAGFTPPDSPFAVNSLAHLLSYRPGSSGDRSLRELLRVSEQRLANGDSVYTSMADSRLAHYSWLRKITGHGLADFGAPIELPPDSALLWDAYTSPAARPAGLYEISIRRRLADAVSLLNAKTAYLIAFADNGAECRVAEALGFQYCVSAFVHAPPGWKPQFPA